MVKKHGAGLELGSGNSRFEGYVVDLLDEVMKFFKTAMHVDVLYEIHIVEDGAYGGKAAKTGEWNGMIGELVNGVSYSSLHEGERENVERKRER